MAVRKFDQVKGPLGEHYPIGHVVVGNFLPYVGKVVRVDERRKLVEFKPATIEEMRQRMAHLWGCDPEGEEEWAGMVEAQEKYL